MVAPSLTPGQILGHFRLIEEIGAAAWALFIVPGTRGWSATSRSRCSIPRRWAIPARSRFRSEALILGRLNHPNVESIYDFHSDQGVDYLVIEYVPGTSLNERLHRGSLPEKEVIALGIQLARGLAAAHAQGIIHRDLKPGNLRVTPDNVLKILDFGLAQLFAHREDRTISIENAEEP